MQIHVPNWSNYNARLSHAAKNNSTWFRLEHKLLLGSKYRRTFSGDSFFALCYVFSLCSEQNSDTVEIDFEHVHFQIGLGRTRFIALCDSLKEQGFIEVRTPDEIPPTDVTNNTNIRELVYDEHVPLDRLEELYAMYPRKEGKKRGMAALKKFVKTEEMLERVKRAIERYRADLLKKKTDSKYIKHFATFVNNWEDWDEPGAGEVSFAKSSPKSDEPPVYPNTKPKTFFEINGEAHNPDAIYDDKDSLL